MIITIYIRNILIWSSWPISINILHKINCLPCLVGIQYFNFHKNVELFIYYEINLLETFLCDNIRCGKGLLLIFGSFQ